MATIFHRIWPMALVGCGLLFTVLWSAFLGYRLLDLILRAL